MLGSRAGAELHSALYLRNLQGEDNATCEAYLVSPKVSSITKTDWHRQCSLTKSDSVLSDSVCTDMF